MSARRFEFGLMTLIVAFDQATKALVRAKMPLQSTLEIVPGLLNFTHIRNTGAAFGVLNAVDFPYKAALLTGVAVIALGTIGIYAASLAREQFLARVGLALVVGGAAGNLIDRVTIGSVVDFVDVFWGEYHFWAFNVADSAITVGVAVVILDMMGIGGAHVSETV
jgi:signal peptidase II